LESATVPLQLQLDCAPGYLFFHQFGNARKVFITEEEYKLLIKHLADDIRRPIMVAWITGWRTPSEILTRMKHHLDWKLNRLILEPSETKNREGRFFPLTPELKAILTEVKDSIDIPYLFHHNGEPLSTRNKRGTFKVSKYFSESWIAACKAAGLSNRIPHDFRRSAARRFRSEGYDLKIARKLLGHKTESIFDRYDIITDDDIITEVQKLEGELKTTSQKRQSRNLKLIR
jgi:integrase